MNNAYSMAGFDNPFRRALTATSSGLWSVKTISGPQTVQKSGRGYLGRIGIRLVLALSPLTSVADPWVIERRRQAQPTSYALTESVRRRRISLREARQLALQLMTDIEAARLQAAEEEARRAFDLEDIW